MNFISIPSNYDPVSGGLLYTFETGGDAADLDIRIIDTSSDHAIASKRIYDATYGEIDAAPVLRKMFAYSLADSPTGVHVSYGLSKTICVEVNGERTEPRIFTAVDIDVNDVPCVFGLDDGPVRDIAFGEADQLFFFNHKDGLVEVTASGDGVDETRTYISEPDLSLQIFCMRPADFPAGTERLDVTFRLADKTLSLQYRLVRRPSTARRISWVDDRGIIRFHTFPVCSSRKVKVERDRIYGADGYADVGVRTENILRLVSDYEPLARIERLTGMLSSLFVWLHTDDGWNRASVVSAESSIACDGELNRAEIEVKPALWHIRP